MKNFESTERAVNLGIQQGSSLGPLIFVVYINVLLLYIEGCLDCGAHCHADDLTVFAQINKDATLNDVRNFEIELNLLTKSYNSLGLSLNLSKTEVILFKDVHSRLVTGKQILLNRTAVSLSRSAKFLGTEFCEDLKWLLHFKKRGPKCYAVIAALARLRKAGVPFGALLIFYRSCFIPVLCYLLQSWNAFLRQSWNAFRLSTGPPA